MKLENLLSLDQSFEILHGSKDIFISGVTDSFRMSENHLFFVKNKKFFQEWNEKRHHNKIGLVIDVKFYESLNEELKSLALANTLFLATVADVNLAISRFSKSFYDEKIGNPNDMVDGRQMGTTEIDSSAWIAQGVFIGERVIIKANVKIHPGTVVMSGVEIDEGTEIFSNTVIYRNVKIGKNVRIHSNCSIGADGFGYNFFRGEHLKVWHIGSVEIQDNVEIGSGSCIDAGTFSPTVIGRGTKIDNLVQVGHNCQLGAGVILCGQVAIGGSSTIGDYSVLGGKAGVGNGITIGKGVQVSGNAGVVSNVGDGEVVGGFPARNLKEWLKGLAYVRKMSLGNNKE